MTRLIERAREFGIGASKEGTVTIRNLIHAFEPKSVAVLGASNRQGSLGSIVLANVLKGGFEGKVWPVNPKHKELNGRRCYATVEEIPGIPDPAGAVPSASLERRERVRRSSLLLA